MQSKTFGKAMQFLVAVGTLVSAFALVACGGSDTKNVNVTVGLTNSASITASATLGHAA